MTLVAAWIRQRSERDELIVASDSRLSFGARWDCCPKVFPLAREDSVLEAELARTLIDSLDEDLDENVEQL